MSVRKLIAFDTDGNLVEFEAKLTRKRSEGASPAVQDQIRNDIGTPAAAAGLTPSNNLSDLENFETAQSNLDVYKRALIDDGLLSKAVGNGVRFLGDGKVSPGNSTLLQHGDATEDEPVSGSFVIETTSLSAAQGIAGKYVGGGIEWELELRTDGKLQVTFYDNISANKISAIGDTVLEVNRRYYVGFSYNGNGGSGNDISIYVNETAQSTTLDDAGSYTAMHATTAPFNVGGDINAKYFNGIIYSANIWNFELTADQHKILRRNGNWGLPGAITGKAVGNVYSSDFTAGVDGFSGTGATLTGNYDSTDTGHANTLRIEANDGSSDRAEKSGLLTKGNWYRLEYDRKVVAGSSVQVLAGGVTHESGVGVSGWTKKTFVFKAVSTGAVAFYVANTGTADDELLVDNVKITDLGPRFSLQPHNILPNGDITDESSNGLDGTGTNAQSILPQATHVKTWTPGLEFGGANVNMAFTTQVGYAKRLRPHFWKLTCKMVLSAKGDSTGTLKVTGLPITATTHDEDTNWPIVRMFNGANLNPPVQAHFDGNRNKLFLWDATATGSTTMDDTNFTDNTEVGFSFVVETDEP